MRSAASIYLQLGLEKDPTSREKKRKGRSIERELCENESIASPLALVARKRIDGFSRTCSALSSRPAYNNNPPENRAEFHKRLVYARGRRDRGGEGGEDAVFECVRRTLRMRRETRARRKGKKLSGKTLDFTAIGSRKCDYTGVVVCAGNGDGASAQERPVYMC